MALIPDFNFECSLTNSSGSRILGIDEVGRGPWAGPVTVGAFLLDTSQFDNELFTKAKVRDSKTLNLKQRQNIFSLFRRESFIFDTVHRSSEDIDKNGIQVAIKESIIQLINKFRGNFDFIIVDGNMKLDTNFSYKSIVKADSTCFSVAAASICAKVVRDNHMIEMADKYPGYGFEKNMGYGTAEHLSALKHLGTTPIHRRSYKPIKKLLGL